MTDAINALTALAVTIRAAVAAVNLELAGSGATAIADIDRIRIVADTPAQIRAAWDAYRAAAVAVAEETGRAARRVKVRGYKIWTLDEGGSASAIRYEITREERTALALGHGDSIARAAR
jgi:hypothetical protein